MRSRQAHRSLSREPSIASNLSDFLISPLSAHLRFPFLHEDSVCSNSSDFAVSECSELSMDVSVKEEVNNTFRFLEEIEQDLDDLKTSVLQMDEEVALFNTKPNPYSLKMTFSDYSLSSSKEHSLANGPHETDGVTVQPSKESVGPGPFFGVGWEEDEHQEMETEAVPAAAPQAIGPGAGVRNSDTDAELSLEWDSPEHGWTATATQVRFPLKFLSVLRRMMKCVTERICY